MASLYRSPSYPPEIFLNFLEASLESINNESKVALLGGDFNIDLIKYGLIEHCSEFFNTILSNGFFPCISLPTRISSTSSTLIDNFLCNDLSLISPCTVLIDDISDHFPILIPINAHTSLDNEKQQRPASKCFDYRKSTELIQSLSSKLHSFRSITDAEEAGSILCSVLKTEILRFSVANPQRNNTPIKPYISYSILQSINKKNELYKKFLRNRSQEDERIYKRYRNCLISVIRTAKINYYKRKLEENISDPRKMWDTLLELTRKNKKKDDIPHHFECNGSVIDSKEVIAEKFNEYFSTIATELERKLPNLSCDPLSYIDNQAVDNQFHFCPVTPIAIQDIISNLKNSSGAKDGITMKILKLVAPVVAPALSHLCNLCLRQGIFPSAFKSATIVPIFKSGNPFIFSNYRPISLLSTLSKVLEKVVYIQLVQFLEANDILYKNQFGFRQKHSTYMPISLLYEHISAAISEKQYCAAVYLDFSKAFDTVNHVILRDKMEKYGFSNSVLSFFDSYLSNRSQKVKISDFLSHKPLPVRLGVPQGSVLGPVLFLIYINDIYKSCPNAKFFLFADDTTLLYTASSPSNLEATINESLPRIEKWLGCNRLTLNAKKSVLQLFSCHHTTPDIHVEIDNVPIKRFFSTKYLGVIIDEDLKWSAHIRSVETTIARNLGLIRRAKYCLESNHLLLLYSAFILPFFNYSAQIWGNTYGSKLSRLIILQKKAVRIIAKAGSREHSSPLFKRFNLLKLPHLIQYIQLSMLHSFLFGRLPAPLSERFFLTEDQHRRLIRRRNHFVVPFASTNYRKFSLFVSAPTIWNTVISSKIHDLNDVPWSKVQFKRVIKKIYLDSY